MLSAYLRSCHPERVEGPQVITSTETLRIFLPNTLAYLGGEKKHFNLPRLSPQSPPAHPHPPPSPDKPPPSPYSGAVRLPRRPHQTPTHAKDTSPSPPPPTPAQRPQPMRTNIPNRRQLPIHIRQTNRHRPTASLRGASASLTSFIPGASATPHNRTHSPTSFSFTNRSP